MRTKNQETLDRILKFVNKYYQEHHSSPTINDVAEGVGVARSTTHRYLQELSDRNLIDYGRGILSAPQSAKMKTAYVSAPLVGSIRCGNPEDEEESIEEYSDFVFVNRNGEVQHQGTLNKALQRIMRDCNSEVLEKKGVDSDPVLLPKFSCHVLRHTFATRMCESGLNVKVVQSVLGHADVTTTLDIYVTVTNDLKKREITAFETYLKTGAKQMANV